MREKKALVSFSLLSLLIFLYILLTLFFYTTYTSQKEDIGELSISNQLYQAGFSVNDIVFLAYLSPGTNISYNNYLLDSDIIINTSSNNIYIKKDIHMKTNLYNAAKDPQKTQRILFKPLIFTKNKDYLYITPFKVF